MQFGTGRNMNPCAIQERACTEGCGEDLVMHGIKHYACHNLILFARGDGNRELRHTVNEIRRAVERIDDPLHLAWITAGESPLFRQDRVARKMPAQAGNDGRFRLAINSRDEIELGLAVDLQQVPLCEACSQNLAADLSSFQGGGKKVLML